MSAIESLSKGFPPPAVAKLSITFPSVPPRDKDTYTAINIQVRGRLPNVGSQSRISQLAFSPGSSRLVVLSRRPTNVPVSNNRHWQRLHIFDVASWEPIDLYSHSGLFAPDYRVRAADGARALAFGPESVEQRPTPRSSKPKSRRFRRKGKEKALLAVELPPAVPCVPLVFLYGRQRCSVEKNQGCFDLDIDMAQVEIGGVQKGAHTHNVPVTDPITVSPDGTAMIGRSAEHPTEMYVIKLPSMAHCPQPQDLSVPACIPGHLAPITHLCYMPDGQSLVSLGADGTQRINNLAGPSPGQCLHRVRVDTKGYPASLLAVTPDGVVVVSTWGRQVVRWYPATDVLLCYNLDAVRMVETWPLAFSADGRFLVCRVEKGVDIINVEDGTSAGHLHWKQNGGNYATAAAVSTDARHMALGLLNGRIVMHELLYVEASTVDKDKSVEEPPAYSQYDDD